MTTRTGELKRKRRFGFSIHALLVLALIGLVPTPARAWLYYSVPPIQGTITDATTGKPIENAVLVVRWVKTGYAALHPQRIVMKKMYVATDRNGVFSIPAFWSTHILSGFDSVLWVARHPLYSTVDTGIGREEIDALRQPDNATVDKLAEIHKYASLGASGEIVYKLSLITLREKYKDKPWVEGFNGALDREFLFEGPKYFSTAKQLGLAMNIEAIYKEWDEIAGRFIDVEYIKSSLESGKDRISKGIPED